MERGLHIIAQPDMYANCPDTSMTQMNTAGARMTHFQTVTASGHEGHH